MLECLVSLRSLWPRKGEKTEAEKLDALATTEIDKSEKMNTFFDSRLQECSNVSFNLSEKDRKQLQKADGVLQKWWKFPVLISVGSLLISLLLGFLAVKFYSSSVKSKEEINEIWRAKKLRAVGMKRAEMLKEAAEKGKPVLSDKIFKSPSGAFLSISRFQS